MHAQHTKNNQHDTHAHIICNRPSTAILGLTVLAIGNSVGDWVADTAVARAGKPGMGIASCFGSPLLNDVLGLSVALLVRLLTGVLHWSALSAIFNETAVYLRILIELF